MAELSDKGKCRGRERFIQVAQELVEQRTFDEITIDDIVKAANLSRPTFYYHFSGGSDGFTHRSHSPVAFRHRSDERKPIAVTGDRLP